MKTTTTRTAPPIRQVECKQCGHGWNTELVGRNPLICPACRSWYWYVDPEHTPSRGPKRKKR